MLTKSFIKGDRKLIASHVEDLTSGTESNRGVSQTFVVL